MLPRLLCEQLCSLNPDEVWCLIEQMHAYCERSGLFYSYTHAYIYIIRCTHICAKNMLV